MIAVYVLLDGFDLGVGIVHLGVARTDAERRAVMGSNRSGTATRSGCWRAAARSSSRFRFSTLPASADSICR